jgi:hypothetical protein
MAQTKFEAHFREFVEDFGGQIVAEGADRSADYFFPQHNVVAELKCLVTDQTTDMLRKRDEIIRRRGTALQAEQPGLVSVATADGAMFSIPYDESFQREWSNVLLTPIEKIIRRANQQIGATKESFAVPSANGVVLIFNEGNPLHAVSPQHYARLVGEVIQKPRSGERRFPHIQGMTYFSFDAIRTLDEQTQKYMPFWLSAQVMGDAVKEITQFQDDLKQGWYQYVERVTVSPVIAHHRETGWPAVD